MAGKFVQVRYDLATASERVKFGLQFLGCGVFVEKTAGCNHMVVRCSSVTFRNHI